MNQDTGLETRVSEQERLIARLQHEIARLRDTADGAAERAARYRVLFDALDTGFSIIQMIYDRGGTPVDSRFLDVNLAFERQTGLKDPVGKSMRGLMPDLEPHWLDTFAEVAHAGEPKRFEDPAALLGRYYDVYAFRMGEPEERTIGVLFSDVSVRKQAEAAWREVSGLKDHFLATLAHELRNPLAPLQSGIEVLRRTSGDRSADQARDEQVLEIMNRQIGHLRHLMDELLDVSQISRGVVTLHKERLDLVSVIRQGMEVARASLPSGRRQVNVELPSEPLPVEGDRERLVQVVAGLLDNAGKFTDEGGRIRLTAARQQGVARLSVEDDGVGLDPDMLETIFEMFSQARTDRHGLGIGLTVVRNLVELHGGTVEARSRGRGTGSEFVVELPLAREEESHQEERTRPRLPPLERQRMLVVDDNRDAADSLSVLLASMGAEVRTAYDGRAALLLLDELQPQIVFLDIGMPEMNGYEVARRLRQRQGGADILLVAVTGWGQPADRQRAREAGFDSHLVKPATFEDLREIVTSRSASPEPRPRPRSPGASRRRR